MFEILPRSDGNRIGVRATAKLTHDDYQRLVPELEARIEEFGALNLLFDLEKFQGWEVRAAWDDFILGIKHMGDFNRVALVGDRKWEELCARVANLFLKFTKGEVRFYAIHDRGAAWGWIES